MHTGAHASGFEVVSSGCLEVGSAPRQLTKLCRVAPELNAMQLLMLLEMNRTYPDDLMPPPREDA